MPTHIRIKLATALVLLVALVLVAAFVDVPSVSDLRVRYGGTGLLGALAFAAIYALLSLLPLPAAVVTIAAGAVFGPVRGSLIVLLGANVAAFIAFYIGRLLGRDAVTHLTGARMEKLDSFLGRSGFMAVLTARLIPVVPFGPFNYLSGFTGVRASRYVAGTALGIIPGTVVYVAVGAYGRKPGSLPFLVSLGALVVLSIVGAVLVRRHRRRPPLAPRSSAQRDRDPRGCDVHGSIYEDRA